jgi:uncharacterized protein (TIGR00255 family)
MSIQSMTGFGRGESNNDRFSLVVEIKSVNNRYKDYRFKMSSLFNFKEVGFKKSLAKNCKRGTFDISINFKESDSVDKFNNLDSEKVLSFLELAKGWGEKSQLKLDFKPTDFLRSEFMVDQEFSKDESLMNLCEEAFGNAIVNLVALRNEEGGKLIEVVKDHLGEYEKSYQKILSQTDELQESVETKLRERFKEYQSELNIEESRFMQEIVFYMEKLDIDEELNRIASHIEKLRSLLNEGGEVGRQIDFLVQELNRETNTIGSKSSMKNTSDLVVHMKVQLEKVREQGLNLE